MMCTRAGLRGLRDGSHLLRGTLSLSALKTPSSIRTTQARSAASTASSAEVEEAFKPHPAPPGSTPDSFGQSTGLERAEIEIPDIFQHNEVLKAPFGTEAEPCLVESAFDSRIVGCTGDAAPHDHDLYWLEVKSGESSTCPLCEQVFALKQI